MERAHSKYPVPRTAGALVRRTTAGVSVAVVALLVVQALVDAVGVDVGATGPTSPFSAVPLVTTTVVAGIGAAVVYAVLVRFTSRPVGIFVLLSVAVFVLMLVPVLFATPEMGVTPVGQGILVLYHLLVAVPLVAFVIGAVQI
ncbi:DUF6069 family protein [Halobacterium wangiae]|uniref:DUF6069 family protein n=1 Tax=Halobacterium wangiae TaxID=2902623 RepID=UPI001E52363C|nr:DUF6069 family protein [Halobacterium wangiae]